MFQSLRSLLGVAEVLRGDPQMAAQLLRASLHALAIHALQTTLEECLLDVGNEERVANLLEWLSLFEDFRFSHQIGVMGERVQVLADFRDPSRFPDYSHFANSKFPARDALVYLDFLARSEQIAKQVDLNAFVQMAERVRDEMEGEFSRLPDIAGLSAQAILTTSVSIAENLARQVMCVRMGKLAVGVAVYRHRYGQWPEKLDDLNQIGMNVSNLVPLGDKPFGYRVEEGMALIWGFEPTIDHAREVPDEPPSLDDPFYRYFNQVWLWRLPPK